MLIEKYFCLKKFNTFKIKVNAKYFIEVKNLYDIFIIFKIFTKYIPKLFIGNGSNILFLNKYYPGVVIKIGFKGKKIIFENDNYAIVKAFSGEDWSNFVKWTVNNKLIGLENLAFIPGTVGAAPIQNIGAYGKEIKENILKIQVYNIHIQKINELYNKECYFSYRSSIFKTIYKNKLLILSVYFILKKNINKFNTSYSDLNKELKSMKISNINSKNIMKAIFNIRKNKIPNINYIGNAGSFFTNPIIHINTFNKLKNIYKNIKGHYIYHNRVKISASYLIESIGWKGKKIGKVGISNKQPIILLNYGGATGWEIYKIAKTIQIKVKKKFGITLSLEVNIINELNKINIIN